ncbi:microtubule-associated tumor suppressor 1 homolog [Gastrophryne carolinensis]
MNVQKLKESLASTYGSPLLYDGDNGNDEEQKDECSEYKCNINYNSLPSVEAQCEFESCGYAVSQGTNGLEYENTVDYTCKNTQVGILKVTGQPDTCTVELEETVDYVNNTRSEAKGSLLPLGKLSTSPDAFQDMHNLQKFELPINLRLDLSEICCEKTELERTLQLTLDQTDEACEHTEFIQESLGLLFTKHKDMAPSLSLLSCDLSSEMRLRKNSLILSSSEKPMSTSILESSTLPNTSTDVFSVSLQWANNGADCCQSVEQCAKDINYSEVPPHISKEKLLFTKGPEATNQLLELKVNLAACSTPKELNGKVLETPCAINDSITINDIDTNFVDSLSNLAQAAVIPVLNIVEDDSNAKEENGVHVEQPISKSSCISQSCSSESKDLLNMLSGHTVDDTFLIDSPSFHTDSKAYTSTPLPESKNMTFAVPLLEDSELIETLKKVEDTKDQIKGGGSAGPSGTSKPINKKLSAVTSVTKVKKTEVVSFPKPNFRNVKAKVLSRPALMAKDCLSKPSPRSPQSASNASSPVASPRAPFSAIKSVKRRSVPDQDLKAETVVAKLNKQPINKQLSPSQLAHAPTHTKYALGKVPRTAVLKQTQDDVERTSSSNSTRSSGSAAALTCTTSSRVSESKGDKAKTTLKPAAVNGAHMGPDTIVQNGLPDADFEKSQPRKENCTSADIFSSAEPFSAKLTAPNKNLHNQLLSSLKTSVSQSVPKARLHSSERRVSLGKNVVIRVSSPPNANQQPAATTGTSSIKTDEVPAKCMRQNGISGAQPAKVTLSRLRAQPLKAAQTGWYYDD